MQTNIGNDNYKLRRTGNRHGQLIQARFPSPVPIKFSIKSRFCRGRVSPNLPFMFKPADLFDLNQTEHAAISTAANSPGTRSKKLKLHRRKPETSASQERRTGIHWRERFFLVKARWLRMRDDQRPGHSSAKTVRFATTPTSAKTSSSATVVSSQFKRTEKLAVVQRCQRGALQLHRRLPFSGYRRISARRESFQLQTVPATSR